MSEVETHLLASTDGYTTKGRSPGISPEEIRELEQLIHGQPDDPAILASMASVPTAMVRRFASSGRYAISRILPGRPDSAGRQTIAVCSLVMPAETYASLAAGDLWSVLNAANLWKIDNFSSGRPVRLPDRGAVLRRVVARDIGLYDAWLRARQQPRGLASTPSLPDSDRAIVDLTQVLPPRDRMEYLWGCRMLSAQAQVSIASFVRIEQAHASRRPLVNITPEVHSDVGRRAIASVGQMQIAVPEPVSSTKPVIRDALRLDDGQIFLEPDVKASHAEPSFAQYSGLPRASPPRSAASWWRWLVIGMAGFAVIAAIAAVFILRKPGKPAELKVVSGTDSLTLSWDEASAATTYRISRWHVPANKPPKDDEVITEAISVTTPPDQPNRRAWTLKKTNPGERWTFQVVAVSWAGMHSEASEPETHTVPLGPPEKPEVTSSTGDAPVLKWSKVSGAVRYTVEVLDMNTRKILKERSDLEIPECPLGDWQSQLAKHPEPLSLRVKARSADEVESEPKEIPWPSKKNASAPQGSGPSPSSGGDKPPADDGTDQPPKDAKLFNVENFSCKADPEKMNLEISWEVVSDAQQNQLEVQIQWGDCPDKPPYEQTVSPEPLESNLDAGRYFYKISQPDRLSETLQVSIRPTGGGPLSLHTIERKRIDGFKVECETHKVKLLCPWLQGAEKHDARVLVSRSKPEDCLSPSGDRERYKFEEQLDWGPALWPKEKSGADGSRLWLTIVYPSGLSNTVELDRPPCPAEPSPPAADTPPAPSDDALSSDMKKAVSDYIKPVKYEDSKRVSMAMLKPMVRDFESQINTFEDQVTNWLRSLKNVPLFSKPDGPKWLQARLTSLSIAVTEKAKDQVTASFDPAAPSLKEMQVALLVASLESSLVNAVTEWKHESDERTKKALTEAAHNATDVCRKWLESKFEGPLKDAVQEKDKMPDAWLADLEQLQSTRETAEKRFQEDCPKFNRDPAKWRKEHPDPKDCNGPLLPADVGPELLKAYAQLIGSLLANPDDEVTKPLKLGKKFQDSQKFWSDTWKHPVPSENQTPPNPQTSPSTTSARISSNDTLRTLAVLAKYVERRLPQLTAPAKP